MPVDATIPSSGRSPRAFRRTVVRGLGIVLPPLLTVVIFLWAGSTIRQYVLDPMIVLTRNGLARGLAASVSARGVALYEGTRAERIESGRVITDHGVVTAPIVVRATEGFTPRLPGLGRAVVPVYSLIIATEALPASVWDEIGLAHRLFR